MLLAVAALSSCGNVTTSNFACQNAACQANLSGGGAEAELDSLGLTVQLAEVDGEEATFEVFGEDGGPDEEVTLSEGESADVLGAQMTLDSVEGDEVGFTIGRG